MWLSISDGSSRWKGQHQEEEEGNEDKQTNKMCLHWPEGKLKPPWPVVCCLFNEKICWPNPPPASCYMFEQWESLIPTLKESF